MTPQQPTQPPHPITPQPAGLTARLTAKLIDLTITAAIAFIAETTFRVLTLNLSISHYTDPQAYGAASLFVAVLLFEVALIVNTARKGTTPGRRLLRIKVVARSDSGTPSPLGAISRWVLPLVVAAPLVDAFIRDIPERANDETSAAMSGRAWWLWVAVGWWLLVHASTLWDNQRRGWHDKAAGTIVVKAPRPPRPAQQHDLLTEWQRRRDLPFE